MTLLYRPIAYLAFSKTFTLRHMPYPKKSPRKRRIYYRKCYKKYNHRFSPPSCLLTWLGRNPKIELTSIAYSHIRFTMPICQLGHWVPRLQTTVTVLSTKKLPLRMRMCMSVKIHSSMMRNPLINPNQLQVVVSCITIPVRCPRCA